MNAETVLSATSDAPSPALLESTEPCEVRRKAPAIIPKPSASNLDNCLKVLSGIQDQIRFADTKAAFIVATNTLMFGFVAAGVSNLKRSLTGGSMPPPATWVSLVFLVLFFICFVVAVATLVFAVMSRFGAKAPKTRIFFGHIATVYGNDFGKFVGDVRSMSDDDWFNDVGTQIVETSNIAQTKHAAVRIAAMVSLVGLANWVVAVFCNSLIP